MQTLSLNGEWRLTYTSLEKQEEKWGRWIPAQVPGDIHLDLMQANLIAEPLVGMNSTCYRWIEEKSWWYMRRFNVDPAFLGQKMELACNGLDLTADLWLNGQLVGTANNMFRQHRFDITPVLKAGENELVIRLDVGFNAAKDAPTDKFIKSWGRHEPRRPWLRKAQQAFYWDVAPRLVTCGIWRDIFIESHHDITLRDVHLTDTLDASSAQVNVEVELEAFSAQKLPCEVEIRLWDDQTEIKRTFAITPAEGKSTANFALEVKNPKLWWPNGVGEPHLYEVKVVLKNSESGAIYGEKGLRHGIRTITLSQEPLNDQEKTFTVVVNGVNVYCKGGNWVPSDAIYARIHREKEYALLKYAQEANINMIRVWGGGVYPDGFFYDFCDEFGIMVWQDFMYACSFYPDDEPAFCEDARQEADWIVRKFRNHASLALWCGNNENYWMHHRADPDGIFYGQKIYEEILPEAIHRLDGKTYYHPSSPFPGFSPGQEREGDQHVWSYTLGWFESRKGGWDHPEEERTDVMRVWDMAEKNCKFVSEFGLWAPVNPASLQKFMGEFPAVVDGSVYQHHRNYFEDDFILEMLRRYYKRRPAYSQAEFTIAGQAMQAEVIKHTLEEFRSRMYVCSGTLFWEYNDTWGHVGYSPVDYYLNVRPIYYYMKRAYAPLHVMIKSDASQIWLLNDTPETHEVSVEYGFMTFDGVVELSCKKTVQIGGTTSLLIDRLDAEKARISDPQRTFAFVRLFNRQGVQIDRNRVFLAPIAQMAFASNGLTRQITRIDECTWNVTVSSKTFTWMVKIDADENLICSDNAFDLWPGESKTVIVKVEKPDPYLQLRVESLNQYITQ